MCFLFWNELQREPFIMPQVLCLNHIHSVPSYPRRPLVTYQRCTVQVHMRNFSCCDGAVGHFNCDTGFILRSAALWKRYSVESCTHKEVCTEVLWREQYIAFQKRGFLVSVHVIIEKWKKKKNKKETLQFTVSQGDKLMCS